MSTTTRVVRVADLLEALEGVDPWTCIGIEVHSPTGCCDDPHPHDVEYLYAEVIEVESGGNELTIRASGLSV